jgi:hypothetical protein
MSVRITKNLLIFIHILIVLYTILYGICVQNNKYDYIYLAYIYFLLLHWTFFKGECIVSYYFKKIQNNEYELGSDFTNDEYYYILGDYKKYGIVFASIILIINILIISNRNNIKNYIIFIFILLLQSYTLVLSFFTNYNKNINFQLFNEIIKIFLIFFGIYIFINYKQILN